MPPAERRARRTILDSAAAERRRWADECSFEDDMDAVAKSGGPDALEIAPEALTSAVAAALIAALNAELSARYPEPGATHFHLDPREVAPGAGVFLVARWLGRPVGCGALRRLREDAVLGELGPRVGELKRMYVAPEMRGRGIGRALLDRLEAEARTLGLARLVLETGTRQAEALALYRHAGFTAIAAYGEYAASPGTSVCLAKPL
jgi:putative acetyltransferase